jgi:copper transport protein
VLQEPPKEIRLWFDETISPKFSTAQVFDIHSQPIEGVTTRTVPSDPTVLIIVLPELAEGSYSVLYGVLSQVDGHISKGVVVFGIGEGMTPDMPAGSTSEPLPPLVETMLRWINFSLLAALIGSLSMAAFVLTPSSEAALSQQKTNHVRRSARARVLSWALISGGLALLVGFGLLYWQTLTVLHTLPQGVGFGEVLGQVVLGSRWGRFWIARQVVLASLLAVTAVLRQHGDASSKPQPSHTFPHRFRWIIAALLSMSLLTIQALIGHAAALTENTQVAVVVDIVHLGAASLWVGGLLALVVGLLPLLIRNHTEFTALVHATWKPFSLIAVISVGLLTGTGLYSAGRQVASVDALLTTVYGKALLGKVGLVLFIGAIGFVNSMLLHPGVAAVVAKLLRRPAGWTLLSIRQFPILVVAEVSLGIGVLLLTGFLTGTRAPRGIEYTIAPEAIPNALTEAVDDLIITISAKPNRPGQNVFTVFAASSLRPVPAEITRVILRFRNQEQDMGLVSATADEVEPGRFLVGGSQMSLAGPWQIQVIVRRQGMEDSVATFDWIVAPVGQVQPVLISKAPMATPLSIAGVLVLVALPVIIGGLWVFKPRSVVNLTGTMTVAVDGASNGDGRPAMKWAGPSVDEVQNGSHLRSTATQPETMKD